jgi:hypothetical protein
MIRMTNRERMRAIVCGQPVDRVPFVQYDNLAARNEEIWGNLGRDAMGLLRWCSVTRTVAPHCTHHSEAIDINGLPGRRDTITTPVGTLTQESCAEPGYGSPSIRTYYVSAPEDYRVLESYLADCRVERDESSFVQAREELGDDGLPLVRLPRTPYQQMWIEWVGMENFAYHLACFPDLVAPCVEHMRRLSLESYDITADSEAEFIDIPDNITAPLIGADYFREYCVPLYRELARRLEPSGRPVIVHLDGDQQALHGAIGDSGMGGIDSYNPPPDGDTSPATALALWPHMRLFVNFPSSVHLDTAQRIRACAEDLLAQAGQSGRMWIQISENVPEGMWRRSFPEIVGAIREFGAPSAGCICPTR